MEGVQGRVLKADHVELEGQFHLDVAQPQPGQAKAKNVTSATPQVSIVESQPEFAVIEITCSCGTKTYLRCQYADAKPSAEPAPSQNTVNGAQNPNQTK
jgi:hypothetical protein